MKTDHLAAVLTTLALLVAGPLGHVVEAAKKAKKDPSSRSKRGSLIGGSSTVTTISGDGLSTNQILAALQGEDDGEKDEENGGSNSIKSKKNKSKRDDGNGGGDETTTFGATSTVVTRSGDALLVGGTNVPDSTMGASKTFGAFTFQFTPSFDTMSYQLLVEQTGSFATSQVVDGAALYCGTTNDIGAFTPNTKLADLNYDFNAGDIEESFVHSSVNTANGFLDPPIPCGDVLEVSTVAGLYAAMANGDVFIEVEVYENGQTKLIRSQLEIDYPSISSSSSLSGSTIANYASILSSEKDPIDIGDRSANAHFQFGFAYYDDDDDDDDAGLVSEMLYRTSGSDAFASSAGAFQIFQDMGLYCGNAGQPTTTAAAVKIASLRFSPSGEAVEASLQRISTAVTCNGVSIGTVVGLETAIDGGSVFFRAETVDGTFIRGQVYPSSS